MSIDRNQIPQTEPENKLIKIDNQTCSQEMADTDLEMFMEKLRGIVYENDNNTSIRFNQIIKARNPEIQLLYEELDYLIRCCLTQLHDLEDAGNWKRRLIDAAYEAEATVDMFVSSVILKNEIKVDYLYYHFDVDWGYLKKFFLETTAHISVDSLLDSSLKDFKYVMDSLKSIREEMIHKKGNLVKQNMMISDKTTGICSSRNTIVNLSETEHDEFIVGFVEDAQLIIDRLTRDNKKLDIISIVGMGGLGKTTLATKIFNDALVEYHFDRRGWITVSQKHTKRDILVQLLVSLGMSVQEAASESKLCEMLNHSLKDRKFLIVIDDIWSSEAWDDLGLRFLNNNNGSRVLVTTRLTEVASHISRRGFTHNLRQLTEDQSWDLLCRKTFRGYECPESLTETGKHIAKKCGGLPLALVVIAGLLEKGEKSKDLWHKIAESVGSYVINDPEGCLNTLALSYDHLPCDLKKCFLYVGGFPEDYKIHVQTLIRLWMAEGFIKEVGQRSLEEEAKLRQKDLIDRNLLIIADKRSNGGIKSCRLHDLLRELSLKKAIEENFFKKMSMSMSNNNPFLDSTSAIVKHRRLFTNNRVLKEIYSRGLTTHTRSVLCFDESHLSTNWVPSFLLLRVLHLLNSPIESFRNIIYLVHLRYLAVWSRGQLFSALNESSLSYASLRSVQTLIVKGKYQSFTYSPDNMVNLRHLRCQIIHIPNDFSVPALSNLQTISRLELDHRAQFLLQSFPNIKKLGCSISSTSSHDVFTLLNHLEDLNIERHKYKSSTLVNHFRFPDTLKKLTLKGLCLPWVYMSTIQQIPKLEVLKLLDSSFKGHLWETGDVHFHRLKFLKLEKLNIRFWEASRINFPVLRKLVVRKCQSLKEIPLELGKIYTFEHIEIDYSNSSLQESVNRIHEAQREIQNYDFRVNFTHDDPSNVFFEGDPFYD